MFNLLGGHFRWRHQRFYSKNRWHLVLDLSLSIMVFLLATAVIALHLYRPAANTNYIGREVSGGAVDLNHPPLSLEFKPEKSALKRGGIAHLSVSYGNESSLNLEAINILLDVKSGPDIVEIKAASTSSQIKISGRQIVIERIGGLERGEFGLDIRFADKTDDKTLSWRAATSYKISGQEFKDDISLPDFKLISEIKASAKAYYTSPQGDQLGVGPLPPVVGQPTTYWIFWQLEADGAFSQAVFSARLPENVELTGRRSLLIGDFQYNAGNRQVLWKISDLQAAGENYRASFEIRLLPDESQLGSRAELSEDAYYQAIDNLTGEKVYGRLPHLSTDLPDDSFNQGQGFVLSQ